MNKPIRFAVVGARRGAGFIETAQAMGDGVELVAVCDVRPEQLTPWKDVDGVRCYFDYQQVLDDPEIDVVCLASPLPQHGSQAIAALNAGKHVLSEVTAAGTVEECWNLVEAVERSGLTYMMAENYCFMRDVMMVQEMVCRGVFGEITFAEGSYIHDCRHYFFAPDDELTWRGTIHREQTGNTYPTHSLGPVCRWLDINRGDRLVSAATWQSRARAAAHYARRNVPNRPEMGEADFWRHCDTASSLLRTEKGILIESRIDWASARPTHMMRYGLQGTTAAFCSQADAQLEPLVWIEDRSPTNAKGHAMGWEPLYTYADEFEHPLWRAHMQEAAAAGHGGGDFFVLREFVAAMREGRPPMIDVYDAVTWSSITPLSQLSIERGNAPVEVPDFKGGR